MLFNSLEFFIFLGIVFFVYAVLKKKQRQNYFLLAASYVFYACWDWRFLSLILISTISDYCLSLKIDQSENEKKRRLFLWLSIGINLGILGFFKYFNFFVESFSGFLYLFNVQIDSPALNIILPMGISFYTFQTMSYTIDVYRRKCQPTKNLFDFALYVSFFPQLVAGPIERAGRLLPQIQNSRILTLKGFKEGCYLIYLGLFMKIFVADNLAKIVNPVFSSETEQSGALILIAVYAFAFQIFCDFAGYSSIARGVAKLFGFELMLNFNLPYGASNPQEFWRRWHISLSTWLRDYIYIPLGGSKGTQWLNLRNLIVVMFLGGLWHGAAWTFVVWGLYHGILLVAHRAVKKKESDQPSNSMVKCFKVIFFFQLISFGWLIFRAQSLGQVIDFTNSIIFNFTVNESVLEILVRFCFILLPLCILKGVQTRTGDLMILYKQSWVVQTIIYAFMAYLILGWGVMESQEFIYFQF